MELRHTSRITRAARTGLLPAALAVLLLGGAGRATAQDPAADFQEIPVAVQPETAAPTPAAPTPAGTESFDYAAVDLRVAVWTDRAADEVYRKGETMTMGFQTNADAYAVVYRIDTEGRVTVLWPRSRMDDGFVFGGHEYGLPVQGGPALRAAQAEGEGFVEVIVSRYPFDLRALQLDFHHEPVAEPVDFRVVGDPFLAINEVNFAITGLENAEDHVVTNFASYYVHREVDHPRYLCGQCHFDDGPQYDPYRDTCSLNINVRLPLEQWLVVQLRLLPGVLQPVLRVRRSLDLAALGELLVRPLVVRSRGQRLLLADNVLRLVRQPLLRRRLLHRLQRHAALRAAESQRPGRRRLPRQDPRVRSDHADAGRRGHRRDPRCGDSWTRAPPTRARRGRPAAHRPSATPCAPAAPPACASARAAACEAERPASRTGCATRRQVHGLRRRWCRSRASRPAAVSVCARRAPWARPSSGHRSNSGPGPAAGPRVGPSRRWPRARRAPASGTPAAAAATTAPVDPNRSVPAAAPAAATRAGTAPCGNAAAAKAATAATAAAVPRAGTPARGPAAVRAAAAARPPAAAAVPAAAAEGDPPAVPAAAASPGAVRPRAAAPAGAEVERNRNPRVCVGGFSPHHPPAGERPDSRRGWQPDGKGSEPDGRGHQHMTGEPGGGMSIRGDRYRVRALRFL